VAGSELAETGYVFTSNLGTPVEPDSRDALLHTYRHIGDPHDTARSTPRSL
jgi:hypothetical protein